jgi:hypothetical protein
MKPRIIEHAIYVLVIVLSLMVLWLVANVPADFFDTRSVYQGF